MNKKRSKICSPLIAGLERSILSGKLPSGSKLPGEKRLAERHGLSRAAVREALETLKSRGLVTSRQGSGSYVAKDAGSAALTDSISVYASLRQDRSTYRQLMSLRMFIEGECIAVLAEKHMVASRDRLRKKLAAMDQRKSSLASFGKADLSFHFTLVEESGHKLYASIMRGLLQGIGFKYARETYVDPGFVGRVLDEHRAIYAALDQGNASAARKALHTHLMHSLQRMEKIVSGNGSRLCRERH